MIKLLSILLSLIFFNPHPVPVSRKLVTKTLERSVLLHIKTITKEGKEYGKCSGTYIAPTYILTAAHCVDGMPGESIWAKGINNSVGYPVNLVRRSTAVDLALLKAPFPHPYAKLGKMPEQGDFVLNVGSPAHFEFVVSEGIVGMIHKKITGFSAHYLVTTAMINPGSSGGGAFNKKGELIGVNTMMVGLFGWTGISLAVEVEDVRKFISYLN